MLSPDVSDHLRRIGLIDSQTATALRELGDYLNAMPGMEQRSLWTEWSAVADAPEWKVRLASSPGEAFAAPPFNGGKTSVSRGRSSRRRVVSTVRVGRAPLATESRQRSRDCWTTQGPPEFVVIPDELAVDPPGRAIQVSADMRDARFAAQL